VNKHLSVGLLFFTLLPSVVIGQGFTRYTYHDEAKKNLKEIYQVRDTIKNILQGRYISYFLNGNVESKGLFVNNETTGVWEFYYETGNLKMRGVLRQNSNYGLWEYFYENGQKSMEGTINEKQREGEWKIYYESGDLKEVGQYKNNKREGLWKTYFEDGTLRGEIEYTNDNGRYTEYYHSGKVMAEGPKAGVRQVGFWRTYAEDGTLQGEGEYANGKRNGEWKFFYPSGKTASTGRYENDEPTGKWNYYFEDGKVSSTGDFVGGQKNGYWSSFHADGSLRNEITFNNGSGEFREYHANGKLKIKGMVVNGKNQGKWQYFFADGKLEGECDYKEGKGTFTGYYPNGTRQTKGEMEGDERVGTWELYHEDGTLSGYYKPFYEDQAKANEINSLINKTKTVTTRTSKTAWKGFYYFTPRSPEYKSVILQSNPAFSFIGFIPFGIEFYNQGRLGHEFEFEGIRNPFYTGDSSVPMNDVFERGYAIALKQKFYNPMSFGMWYFAQEIRFVNVGHFSNISLSNTTTDLFTVSASEQRAEYGLQLGARLMQRNNADGFTIDAFAGYSIGYRVFDVDPVYEDVFSSVNKNKFAQTFRFGLNFGYSLSFDGRR